MQKFSYHCHTNFSDGHNTITEMLNCAEQLGWEEIGISDHLIVHKNVKQSISWPYWAKAANKHVYYSDFKKAQDDFCRHKENIMKSAKARNIKVRIGAEVDYFIYDGWLDEFNEFRKETELDYYISGNHFLQSDKGDSIADMKESKILPPEDIKKMLSKHFDCICQAIESKIFCFIAHIDYARQNPLCGDKDFIFEKKKVLEALQRNGICTELSTKGLRKDGKYYPTEWLIEDIIRKNIGLVISDDAHRVDELGYGFLQAEAYLAEKNCRKRWFFK